MSKVALAVETRALVMQRSGHCCEYCKSQDKFSPVYFTIDHIAPLIEGGSNDIENVAYACMPCNRLKWKKTMVFDPISQVNVPIFNPRLDVWERHFQWSGNYLSIIGISATGRAMVSELQLIRKKLIRYRKEMFDIGYHPPLLGE
jgi:hypothetical protein